MRQRLLRLARNDRKRAPLSRREALKGDCAAAEEEQRRVFDVIVATLALVVLSPLLALIALLIKLESPGPVLFRQKRVGKDEKPFEVLKFRSMTVAPPEEARAARHRGVPVPAAGGEDGPRPGTARLQPGRAAEPAERPARRHARRRAAPGRAGAGGAVPAGVAPASRREACDHGPGPDQRPHRFDLRRDHGLRSRLRRQTPVLGRRADHAEDARRRPPPRRRPMKDDAPAIAGRRDWLLRSGRLALSLLLDISIVLLSYVLALSLKFDGDVPGESWRQLAWAGPLIAFAYILAYQVPGGFRAGGQDGAGRAG